jgi:FixJ family two-component response regulator
VRPYERNKSVSEAGWTEVAKIDLDPTLYQRIIARPLSAGLSLGNMTTLKVPKVVVIVDDDESVRESLDALIKAVGLPAMAFASAEEFLNSGQEQNTACLISDIRMPGMSGLELQARLSKAGYKIPIIFITAHGEEKVRMQALRAGAVEFLTKPFDDEALLDSVHAALSS